MIEITGDIWKQSCDYRVITTNGFVKKNGKAVMGRGIALQAARKFPKLPLELGQTISHCRNTVHLFPTYRIITFPVKHVWNQLADLQLIKKSTEQLIVLLDRLDNPEVCMPRPGCNNGKLKWEDVRPIISVLPDNVKVVDWAR